MRLPSSNGRSKSSTASFLGNAGRGGVPYAEFVYVASPISGSWQSAPCRYDGRPDDGVERRPEVSRRASSHEGTRYSSGLLFAMTATTTWFLTARQTTGVDRGACTGTASFEFPTTRTAMEPPASPGPSQRQAGARSRAPVRRAAPSATRARCTRPGRAAPIERPARRALRR